MRKKNQRYPISSSFFAVIDELLEIYIQNRNHYSGSNDIQLTKPFSSIAKSIRVNYEFMIIIQSMSMYLKKLY